MSLAAHRSVVCSDGRHHACRPEEWGCNCPCHLGAAVAASSSDEADSAPPAHGDDTGAAETTVDGDGQVQALGDEADPSGLTVGDLRLPTLHPKTGNASGFGPEALQRRVG